MLFHFYKQELIENSGRYRYGFVWGKKAQDITEIQKMPYWLVFI